ncbi:MAG: hypothetical protein JKY88_19725 [Pseudomonadales bacterium]|nr:hypothetical protein [Pseudomonadales bacterium]
MKILKIASPLILLIFVVFLWLAPIGPVPGIFIGGTLTEVPDSWGVTSTTHEIQLKVEGDILPRVVTIWVIQVDGELHIIGSKEAGWVSILGQGGAVQMRLGDKTYNLNATVVASNLDMIVKQYKDKYRPDYPNIVEGIPSLEEAPNYAMVYKLTKA